MANVLDVTMQALVTALTAHAGLSTMTLTGIYQDVAPKGTGTPFLLLQNMAGGETNVTRRRDAQLRIKVACVAATRATAETGAGHIDDALHNTADLTGLGTGWSCYKCQAIQNERQVYEFQGRQVYEAGVIFELWLSQG